jgi:transglutaminase-like putative cysteine protease
VPTLTTPFALDAYLGRSPWIDHDHPAIEARAAEHCARAHGEVEAAREAYRFVRDGIAHSMDVQERRVTASASEVLIQGHGICYAKSHLLAALLRAMGIPAGLCYQRLAAGDRPEDGHVLHGLNALYLARAGGWIRVDARGNKAGIDAQFAVDAERLAFPVREAWGERDYRVILPGPPAAVVDVLRRFDDAVEMCHTGLPAALD